MIASTLNFLNLLNIQYNFYSFHGEYSRLASTLNFLNQIKLPVSVEKVEGWGGVLLAEWIKIIGYSAGSGLTIITFTCIMPYEYLGLQSYKVTELEGFLWKWKNRRKMGKWCKTHNPLAPTWMNWRLHSTRKLIDLTWTSRLVSLESKPMLCMYYWGPILATKANTADVDTSLALKANTTDLDTSLALKANTTDVDTSWG